MNQRNHITHSVVIVQAVFCKLDTSVNCPGKYGSIIVTSCYCALLGQYIVRDFGTLQQFAGVFFFFFCDNLFIIRVIKLSVCSHQVFALECEVHFRVGNSESFLISPINHIRQ